MATNRTSALPPPALAPRADAEPTFVPEEPLARALNRIKGEGRRRIVAGLFASGVPLARIPSLLLRENLTAHEHGVAWRTNAWPLGGERLPDLLPGEVEEVRVLWLLPDDERVLSLRARPGLGGAAWRLVDDIGSTYHLPHAFSPWPATDRDVVGLLDGARSASLPYPLGALRSCWEAARRLGLGRERVRGSSAGRTVVSKRQLAEAVEELFEEYWTSAGGREARALRPAVEVVQ